jgi:hypothetical protein
MIVRLDFGGIFFSILFPKYVLIIE